MILIVDNRTGLSVERKIRTLFLKMCSIKMSSRVKIDCTLG